MPSQPADLAFHLDTCSAQAITGWAHHRSGPVAVRALVDGRPVGSVTSGLRRPDVAALRPTSPTALDSGFTIVFADVTFPTDKPCDVVVEFTAADATVARDHRRVWPLVVPLGQVGASQAPSSPLPADVVACLIELWPDHYRVAPSWGPDDVGRAVADIAEILRDRAIVKPVLRYAQFLSSMHATFGFISTHFDRVNRLVDPTAKDYGAVATSAEEMLCIANHLYVLASRGLEGAFVELGCFKGFSSCCLSQACAWLGIDMHIFDSFAGLPPSPGQYYQEGDFRGTLDEVRDNLATFGHPAAVQFHQGFFSETVPEFTDRILCMWMDVDLVSSAHDAMGLLATLDPASCVFSHECPPAAFIGDEPQPQATEVLAPILDAFTARGASPRGRHLAGYLGAVWDEGPGLPVLGTADVMAVVAAATG